MKLKIKIKNKEYEIDILEKDGNNLSVKVGDKNFVFGMSKSAKEQRSKTENSVFSKEIKSSLSGIISNVFVKEGEMVDAGEKVLTLSAMKMENEIVSESKGRIKKILVKEGDKVKEGETLIVLE
jgi:biotin carboxyl carrier protein